MEAEDSGLSRWEDKAHRYVEAAAPGMTPEDVAVSYDKCVLWMKAEKNTQIKNSREIRNEKSIL